MHTRTALTTNVPTVIHPSHHVNNIQSVPQLTGTPSKLSVLEPMLSRP